MGSWSCDCHERLDGSRLKNDRSNGTLVPSTLEIVKTGVIADLPKPLTASINSSTDLTAYGCLRAPGSLSSRESCFIVSFITGSGQRSTW